MAAAYGRYMTNIKITSNPYKKEIKYQLWSDAQNDWQDIKETSNSSKLLGKDFATGFFPFQAEKIVSQIAEDYYVDGEKILILFEGSSDEFDELEAVCNKEDFSEKITVEKSNRYLNNARDILPSVKELFQKMVPLVHKSTDLQEVEQEMQRFADASSDVVPICVMGNYSSGKSTLINALIGSEILPNGSDPVTAKVYKISKTKSDDRASVRFSFKNQQILLSLTAKDTKLDGFSEVSELSLLIGQEVLSMENATIEERMNKAMHIINDYSNTVDGRGISDLIEIEVPFVRGELSTSDYPFVIFDTPGSNSASNVEHASVLKNAMSNMTNGLPVFVATQDSLDSIDNENLYKLMRDLDEQLDNRFTMIVVNKADKNELVRKGSSEEEEKRIMNQAIPRHLYSGGLFYVSSIMGLGAKNGGRFIDDFYDETFEDQERKYTDPKNRRYKQLYTYDIMPSQIKKRVEEQALEQSNLIYANSGLFSLEKEIETFAGKYAAYNKCFQSQMFLSHIIDLTQQEILRKKEEKEERQQEIEDSLEKEKRELIGRMHDACKTEKGIYRSKYAEYMSQYLLGTEDTFSVAKLREKEKELTSEKEEDYGFDDIVGSAKEQRESERKNFFQNFGNVVRERNAETFQSFVSDLQSDRAAVKEHADRQKEARRTIDQEVAEELAAFVKDEYKQHLQNRHEDIDQNSRAYWSDRTEDLRKLLLVIVTGSDVLTEDRRDELQQIIISYQKLELDVSHADEIFKAKDFERAINLGFISLKISDHLNLDKLAKTYNDNLSDNVQRDYNEIQTKHEETAYAWMDNLLDEIRENIVEFSPELSKKAEHLRMVKQEIERLMDRRKTLEGYTEELFAMLDWIEK